MGSRTAIDGAACLCSCSESAVMPMGEGCAVLAHRLQGVTGHSSHGAVSYRAVPYAILLSVSELLRSH